MSASPADLREQMQRRGAQVAAELLGTCKPLYEVATSAEQDSPDFCRALDAVVSKCEACDWWVDTDEIGDDGYCNECGEE